MLREVLECSIIIEIRQTLVVEWNTGRIGTGRQKLLVTGGGALEATAWSMTGERYVGQAGVHHVGQATIHGVGGTGYADVIAQVADGLAELNAVCIVLTLGRVGIEEDTTGLKQE